MKHDKWEQHVFVMGVKNDADFSHVTALPVNSGQCWLFLLLKIGGSHIEIKQLRTEKMPVINCCSSS